MGRREVARKDLAIYLMWRLTTANLTGQPPAHEPSSHRQLGQLSLGGEGHCILVAC